MSKPPAYITAHKASIYHRAEIEASELCGCFHCLRTFPPQEIVCWIDNGQTVMCPKCGIDSVIGSASGYPLTREFLAQMCKHWFDE